MANETILKFGAPKLLEANGASIANNAIVKAAESYSVTEDGNGYPDARFVLNIGMANGAPAMGALSLYAAPLDLLGGNAEAPTAMRPVVFIGNFTPSAKTGVQTQFLELTARDVPWKADYYLHNNGNGVGMGVWKLEVTPFTVAPAA